MEDTLIRRRILESYILEWEQGSTVGIIVDETLETVAIVEVDKFGSVSKVKFLSEYTPILMVQEELITRLFQDQK